MTNSIQQQLHMLRQSSRPGLMRGILVFAVLLVVGLLGASYVWGEFGFVFAAVMVLIVIWGSTQTYPHIRNARRALDSQTKINALVMIHVDKTGESDTYRASATDQQGVWWTFYFRPLGWSPQTGEYPAELCFIDQVPWAALVVTSQGILHPCDTPSLGKLSLASGFPMAHATHLWD